MATPFIATVAIGTALDLRGFATGVGKLRSAASAANGPINNNAGAVGNLSTKLSTAGGHANTLAYAAGIAAGSVTALGDSIARVGRMTSAIGLITGLTGVSIAKTGFDWRKQWNQSTAVTHGTTEEMEALEERVYELGGSTKFTVLEVASAVEFLGKAGNTASEQMELLPVVLDLAAASGVELGRTADLITNIAQGYGIPLDQIAEHGDQITAAFLNSNITLENYADSMKKVGPIAGLLGVDFADLTTAVGLMGNAGIQGSEAGIHLRRTLINLSDPMSQMRSEVVDMLGLSWDEIDLTKHGFIDVLGKISGALLTVKDDMGDAAFESSEFFGLASRLTGARAVSTVGALLQQLGGNYDELSGHVRNSEGAMRDTAAAQLAGIEPFYRLAAAWDRLKISIAESGVLDAMATAAQRLAELFNRLADASGGTKRMIFNLLLLATVAGPILIIIGTLVGAVGRIGTAFLNAARLIGFILSPFGLVTTAMLVVAGVAAFMTGQSIGSFQDLLDGGSSFLSNISNAFWAFIGFIKAIFTGDWDLAWKYAQDVAAHIAAVVVQIMEQLLNTAITLLKTLTQFFADNWDQIANNTVEALEWLFTETEGIMVLLAGVMVVGVSRTARAVSKAAIWMANQFVIGIRWMAEKTKKIWGPVWRAMVNVTRTAAARIALLATTMWNRLIFVLVAWAKKVQEYIKAAMLFMVARFKWMATQIAGAKGAMSKMWAAIISIFVAGMAALKAGLATLGLVFSNPMIAAGAALIAVTTALVVAFKDELKAGFEGAFVVAKLAIAHGINAVANLLTYSNPVFLFLKAIGKAAELLGKSNPFEGSLLNWSGVNIYESFGVADEEGNALTFAGAWRHGSKNLTGQDFIDAGNAALDTVGDVAETVIEFVGDKAEEVFDWAEEAFTDESGFTPATWASAVVPDGWKVTAKEAQTAATNELKNAFNIVKETGGRLVEGTLSLGAELTEEGIKTALGGFKYVLKTLNTVVQTIEPLDDVDPEKVKAKIYALLGSEEEGTAGPLSPEFTTEMVEFADATLDTPEERKEAAKNFVDDLISEITTILQNTFKPDEIADEDEIKPFDAEEAYNLAINNLGNLGVDVVELGKKTIGKVDEAARENLEADAEGVRRLLSAYEDLPTAEDWAGPAPDTETPPLVDDEALNDLVTAINNPPIHAPAAGEDTGGAWPVDPTAPTFTDSIEDATNAVNEFTDNALNVGGGGGVPGVNVPSGVGGFVGGSTLTGALKDITFNFRLFIGDSEIEDLVVYAISEANRAGRLSGLTTAAT